MRFGAQLQPGGVTFNMWAPSVVDVQLCLFRPNGAEDIRPMDRSGDGWFSRTIKDIGAGQRYQYVVNDLRVPDPASRCQDEDVHGPSIVVNPAAYDWRDSSWKGLPWEQTILYELHVGTFTKEGTFRGVIEKLDYLKELGVTAIELMPVSDFPGKRNWGYDGVLHFAPDTAYGTPDDLKALVDAIHARGMMAFLDVVYNHFGPEGNYLYVHSKPFFTEKYKTPWGAAIDFEGKHSPIVRSFFIENATYWLNEYHFDGLRFDAVHAIYDASEKKFLEELAESVKNRFGRERHIHLVLENDDNNAQLLERTAADNKLKFYTAQWNDDFHHCLHVIATGEKSGYYGDYTEAVTARSPSQHLARCLGEGFAYQGEPFQYKAGEPRGNKSAHLPATSFVSFMQNHDQVGNRAFGERIAKLAPKERLAAITAITLLSPQIPMLFMGEEWASKIPFCFFCDFGPALAPLVSEGRRQEFAKFEEFRDEKKRQLIPDPTAEQTYLQSVLDWSERDAEEHREHLEFVRSLLALRTKEIVPRLAGMSSNGMSRKLRGGAIEVRWNLSGAELIMLANLADEPIDFDLRSAADGARILFSLADNPASTAQLPGWSVVWLIKDAK